MLITIQVFNVADGDVCLNPQAASRKLLRAIGFISDNQPFIQSKILAGHEPEVQSQAVREITHWLSANHPDWDICIDGPYVRGV